MKVIYGSDRFKIGTRPRVLTIGNFDGLHLGHQKIMDIVTERSADHGGESVVMTFDPHPRRVIPSRSPPGMLMTLEQKLDCLEGLGVDSVLVEPFTLEYGSMSPQVFIEEVLGRRIQPVEVYVGYDFHFGHDRAGSRQLLTELGPQRGFSVTIVPEVLIGGEDVSSSRIRALLGEGKIQEANGLLGRSYAIRGEVVLGDQRGRQIGFPTLNIDTENEILPQAGVYIGSVRFLGEGKETEFFQSVVNLGIRPTFKSGESLLVEAHLLDFEQEVYGKEVELCFHQRLREERCFEDSSHLQEQIQQDIGMANNWFREAAKGER